MNANANDSLIAATGVGAMLVLDLASARGAMVALGAAAKFGSGAGAAVRHRHRRAPVALRDLLRDRLPGRYRGPDPALPPPNGGLHEFYDRTLATRPAKLAVQRPGPGAVARLPAAGGAGGSDRPRVRRGAVAGAKDARPGRRAGGGGADRHPGRRDALVLLLRRLVPAARARRPVRPSAARARLSRSSSPAGPGSAS